MSQGLFSDVCWIIRTLKSHGFKAFIVGGAVRDLLLGHPPHDFDIATTASPDEILTLFPRAKQVGKSFGTLLIVLEHRPYQVTTLQSSGGTFTDSLERDIFRRDFTINALFWDPLEDSLIDLVGGVKDLHARKLVPVTNADKIFSDDPVRMLRAIRLAHSLRFTLHPTIPPAMRAMRGELHRISPERVQSELVKILSLDAVLAALCPLVTSRILFEILPEMLPLIRLSQTPYHDFSGLSHTFRTVAHTEALYEHGTFLGENITVEKYLLILAALLHDIGKPATGSLTGQIHHFYGHEKIGAELAHGILRRLRFSKRDRTFIKSLVARHMYPLHLFRLKEENALTARAVQRFQRKIKPEIRLSLLILSTADQLSKRRHPHPLRMKTWLAFCQRLLRAEPAPVEQ